MKVSASKSATSPSCKTLYASLKKHELTKTYHHEKESTLLYFDYWIFDYFLINSSTHLK